MRPFSFAILLAGAATLASCASLTPKPNQQLAMSKQACAEAGLTPGTDAFSNCFLGMNASVTFDESAAAR